MCQALWQAGRSGTVPELEGNSGQAGSLTSVGSPHQEGLLLVEGKAEARYSPRGSSDHLPRLLLAGGWELASAYETCRFPHSPCSVKSEPVGIEAQDLTQ